MVPPKYNFYIGSASYVSIDKYTYIDDTGNFDYNADSSKYATNYISISSEKCIFIDLQSPNVYNKLFFYDINKAFISSVLIKNIKNTVIVPPNNVAYYAIRFSSSDEIFMLKHKTNFIYSIESVNPHYKELSKKYAKQNGQEFFRESLEGKISLFGKDYKIVADSGLDDKLIFIINKYNITSDKWAIYYKGEFNKTDCKFNQDKQICELKTTAIDDYTDIINKYDNTYDIIKLAPEIKEIDIYKRSLIQLYIQGSNIITSILGGTYWENEVNEAVNDYNALNDIYHFSYIKAANEFAIKDSSLNDINGIYAGINGNWDNANGFTVYAIQYDNTNGWIAVKRNSDNKTLYMSDIISLDFASNGGNNIYIPAYDSITLSAVEGNGVVTGNCTVYNIFTYHVFMRLLCNLDYIQYKDTTKITYDLPLNNFVTSGMNYRKCIGLESGIIFCTSKTSDTPTKYGINDYGKYFTNEFLPSYASVGRILPISRNSWANASLWYEYSEDYELLDKKTRKQYTLKDSYSIGAAIKAILKAIDPTIMHETTAEYSQFLYGNTNPLGLDRFYVYITQKTNILKGNYDQPAQKAETSLEELMKMLRDCFRCYWYIEDNKFKIEHIYFFINGGSYQNKSNYQLDFTKLTDQFNRKLSSYFQSEIEFEKSDLNQRYEFNWMDDATDLFGGVTIDVKSNYIQKDKTEEISVSQFSSDIDFMLLNSSNFSDDGFALLCPINKYEYIKNLSYEQLTNTSIRSKEININGTVTIIPTDIETFNISIIAKRLNGSLVPTPQYITDSITLKNIATLRITLQYVSGKEITPEDVNGLVYTNVGSIVFNDKLELPIITVDNIIDENGNTYKAIAQNWYASWIYLQNFYMYDMPARNIESNTVTDLLVQHVKMCKTHTIKFPVEEDLDKFELIKTSIGNGKIDEMSINMNTRIAKVKLTYEP